MSEQPHAEHAASGPHVNYLMIFGALCLLTIMSWVADEVGKQMGGTAHASADAHAPAVAHEPAAATGGFNWKILIGGIVLAIACTKATFVLLYFMHVKFEGKWIWAMLLPTLILALAIPAALTPDVALHYYTVETPQADEYANQQSRPEHHPDSPSNTAEGADGKVPQEKHPVTPEHPAKPAEGKHP